MSTESTLLDRPGIEAFADARREPAWMVERRLASMRLFEETPLPRWDRTDLSGFELDRYVTLLRNQMRSAARTPAVVDLWPDPSRALGVRWAELPEAARSALAKPPQGGAVLIHLAGPGTPGQSSLTLRWIDPALQQAGVSLLSLAEALESKEALVRERFMTRAVTPDQGKFMALHGAAWDVGTVVHVPRGLRMEAPIHLVTSMDGARDTLLPHTLVVIEEQARAQVLESWVSPDDAPSDQLVAGAVEILTGPGARLDYVSLQTWGRRVSHFTNRRAVLGRDSQVEWVLGEFGCGLSRGEFEAEMDEPGATSDSVLVFFAGEGQHLDLKNTMIHRGPHTQSDIAARGVLNGSARGVYRAVTHVHRGAREASSYQRGKILVLSESARADANPSVIVEESEVRQAGHAATVGQVDLEQLFYLMSRGLPRQVAIRLIVEGFLQPVLERVPVQAARDRVAEIVRMKLDQA